MAFGSVATITTVETSIDASGRAMQALGERWRLGSDGQRFIVPAIPLTTSRRPNAPGRLPWDLQRSFANFAQSPPPLYPPSRSRKLFTR